MKHTTALIPLLTLGFGLVVTACVAMDGDEEEPEETNNNETWVENDVCPGIPKAQDDGLFKVTGHKCTYEVIALAPVNGKPKQIGLEHIDSDMCMAAPPTPAGKATFGKDLEVTDEISATAKLSLGTKVMTEASASFAKVAEVKVAQEISASVEVGGTVSASRKETIKRAQEVSFPPCTHYNYDIYSWETPVTGKATAKLTYTARYTHSESGYGFDKVVGPETHEIVITGKKAIMGNRTKIQHSDLGCPKVADGCPKKACADAPTLPGSSFAAGECPPDPPYVETCGNGYCGAGEFPDCAQDCLSGALVRGNDVSYDNTCARDTGVSTPCPADGGGTGPGPGPGGGGSGPPRDGGMPPPPRF